MDWFQQYPKGVAHEISLGGKRHLADALEKTCERFATHPAFSCTGKTITYGEYHQYAIAFAGYLQNVLKLKKGDRLAIMLPNSFQFPIAFLAAQKVGVICVATNPLYTPREMEHQFKDSGATAILILDMFLDKLEKILPNTSIKHVISTNISDLLPAWKNALIKKIMQYKGLLPKHHLMTIEFKNALEIGRRQKYQTPPIMLDDVALLQYTGGTTGTSKGAMLSHRNLLSNMEQFHVWFAVSIEEGKETILAALPLYHIGALGVIYLSCSVLGFHLILVPKPVPISNTVKVFQKYRITIVGGVNTLFNALNNDPAFQKLDHSSIRLAFAGAAALQKAVAERWFEVTGVKARQIYGLTEASPLTHSHSPAADGPIESIGLPLPSTDAKIVDKNGTELPIGEPGELIVRGPQVMLGYWNKKEETANAIRDGWLWTGDIAKRDDKGYFYIVDRSKDMIIVSGLKVFPNEVEEVLATHPKVLESAVIGVPDSHSGEAVKAFIVTKDPQLDVKELQEYCKERLTNYKRPKFYEFRKELPKSNVGKILRRELRT